MKTTPIIYWLRRDFRLSDHPGLTAAVLSGRPVIPVFIYDELVESYGAAPKWRLGLAVEHFAKTLLKMGSKLIFRRGRALNVLRDLAGETGAGAVYWTRAYDPAAIKRDTHVKTGLKADGLEAKSHPGHLLFEPWKIETKTGGYYKVFTPMWRAVRDIDLAQELPSITHLLAPLNWPRSDDIDAWQMGLGMGRGVRIVANYVCVGENAANERLATFIRNKVKNYKTARDLLAIDGTSRLSENLTYGEISPRVCWHAAWKTLYDGVSDAEVFLKELVWREFAYHLAYHTPRIVSENWKGEWNNFPWKVDEVYALPWKQGRTGIQLVDAAMREMYVTGTMHNRGRMIVASYLTKHMMTHWKVGQNWFEDCLIDWDPASNAMGWQWAAGSGPDAAPFFRVFNPNTQAEKFDKDRNYRAKYLTECFSNSEATAGQYFEAIPQIWKLSANDSYPAPIVELSVGRHLALEAYKNR